jgi:hypothetical protein
MDIILAVVVASAVILFGALISMGNERQRRAIDQLREQTMLWAMHDLQIKREKLAREVKVDNPQNWLNTIASRVCGYDLKLQIVEIFEEPQSLLCSSTDGQHKIVFSFLSPSHVRGIKKSKHNRLDRFTEHNPLLSLPKDVMGYELSPLNSGILFDLELELVWRNLTGHQLGVTNRLWMYEYS